MSVIDMVETLMSAFLPNQSDANGVNDNDIGSTDDKPRSYGQYGGTISQLVNFGKLTTGFFFILTS